MVILLLLTILSIFQLLFYLFLFTPFMYTFLAVLGLPCWCKLSLVSVSRGYSLVVLGRLFIVGASLVAEHRLPGLQ